MSKRTWMVLGLAAAMGAAGSPASARSDDPGDIAAELREFEATQRKEVDEAIAEVTNQLTEEQKQLSELQVRVAKAQEVLKRLEAIKLALSATDVPEPIGFSGATPVPVMDPAAVTTSSLPPVPSRTTPKPVTLASNSVVVTSGPVPVPSLQAVVPHTCVEGEACCAEDTAVTAAPAPTVEIQGGPDGSLRVISRHQDGDDVAIGQLVCSKLVIREGAIVSVDDKATHRNVGVGTSSCQHDESKAELARLVEALREMVDAHRVPAPTVPTPAVATPGSDSTKR